MYSNSVPHKKTDHDQDSSFHPIRHTQSDPPKLRSLHSSPPPPYSTSPPADLSRVATASPATHAPEEPIIMAPNEQHAQGRAPCDSFLCHSPPANTWINVESSQSEHALLVGLPGFRRDAITIATGKRRILHVVADSWEPEGGHFERRVSFGYDADLAQVRAEFDGEILRIVVPRHVSVTITA
ncbi:hypothetical protein EV363DRAFT_1323765 [Boletus edulis]|uniref:SHSP domain-containing protein n=1 Tax=Boletus edulis BED1 TaxID=1328754 RepID=A0AAD4C0S7_BOLED|nr:hypothetical protein EV363DRAFT_1323765 [Boletus edulis]KAF8444775.1 hypothetical protein L210DRAFT_3530944 [Boletus edulis BED1]